MQKIVKRWSVVSFVIDRILVGKLHYNDRRKFRILKSKQKTMVWTLRTNKAYVNGLKDWLSVSWHKRGPWNFLKCPYYVEI